MMNTDAFLGIDVGGSRCKAILLAGSGAVRSASTARYSTRRGVNGEVTQQPADWERAFASAVRDCLSQVPGSSVASLAFTAPAHAVVLVDKSGAPLAPVLTAQDGRPAAEAARLKKAHGDEIFSRIMVELSSGWTLPQLAWIASEDPQLVRKTRWILPVKDYLRLQLTGEVGSDATDAAGTALYDPLAGCWQEDLCDLTGFSTRCLPPLGGSTAVGGRLSADWAQRLGLQSGIPVVVGATDTAAELVSLEARDPGSGLVKIGSTGAAVGVAAGPRPSRATFTYPHVDGGSWYSVAVTFTAGSAFEWFRAVLSEGGSDRSAANLDALATTVAAGSDGLLFFPYLDGERVPHWRHDLRGAFVGLSSSHTLGHLCRAVLEGVAMSVRDCYEALASLGVAPANPTLSGGGGESPIWSRVLTSVLGVDCVNVKPQGPALGAAMLAAEGMTGRRLEVAVSREAVPIEQSWALVYEKRFQSYRRVAEALVALRAEVQAHFSGEVSGCAAPSPWWTPSASEEPWGVPRSAGP